MVNFISKYLNLPDYVQPEELVDLFNELLLMHERDNSIPAYDIAEAMEQLADRQWHTYTVLNKNIRIQVEDWIKKNWDKKSLMFTEVILSVIGNLGLGGCLSLLKDSLNEKIPTENKKEIIDALNEYEQNINDPFSGLK